MKKLKITFILPAAGHIPVGGFKIVYEYGNHLSKRGHQVTIVHPASLLPPGAARGLQSLRSSARYVVRKLNKSYGPEGWFTVDQSVRLMWVPSLSERHIPDGDVVIATAWQTAEWAAHYPASKGRRFYLIQHFENWDGVQERLQATWKAPLQKIVISKWLESIATELGEDCVYIPNGLDFQRFRILNQIANRNSRKVMMLYHSASNKGSQDGLRALSIAHTEMPEIRAVLFGSSKAPAGLPDWITYYRRPEQGVLCNLYNEASVFVAPSWTEGWGLPASEAMMCGAALAATDIGGHQEFAIHLQTALLSPPKNPAKLAEGILRLLSDEALRSKIAKAGHKFVQQFTWERSTDQMESLLLETEKKSQFDQSISRAELNV